MGPETYRFVLVHSWFPVFLAKKKDPREDINILFYKAVLEPSRSVSARTAALGRGNTNNHLHRDPSQGSKLLLSSKTSLISAITHIGPSGFGNIYWRPMWLVYQHYIWEKNVCKATYKWKDVQRVLPGWSGHLSKDRLISFHFSHLLQLLYTQNIAWYLDKTVFQRRKETMDLRRGGWGFCR